jgi:flagellar biosynthetic protein FlhB
MSGERTEQATPKRREQARDKGSVLRPRELAAALTVLSAVLFLSSKPEILVRGWQSLLRQCLEAGLQPTWSTNLPVLRWVGIAAAQATLPVLSLAFGVALLSMHAQGGIAFSAEAFAPNWDRLDPSKNMKQLFSLAGISRIFRSLVPVGVMLHLALSVAQERMQSILHASRVRPRGILALTGSLLFELAWKCGMVMLAWSGADFLLQRHTFEESLKMSKQDVKQEGKENEGSPEIRMRRRRLRRDMLRKSLKSDVQRATAVITNPTHYAVALEYRPETMAAPVVVAKGRNLIAKKIKDMARWHEIPIVENPPLAQALYKAVEIGHAIPAQLYAAVAEILAFLYRTQARMQQRPAGAR